MRRTHSARQKDPCHDVGDVVPPGKENNFLLAAMSIKYQWGLVGVESISLLIIQTVHDLAAILSGPTLATPT